MNRRTFLAAALGTAVAPGRVLAAAQGGGFVALVTADLESHVAAVEVGSGRIVRRIRTAAGPRSIEGSPYGAAVVAHTAAGVVSLLDTTTLSVHSVLGGFGEPRYTAIHPSERLAYVTDSRRRDVATIDLVRRAVVHRVPVPGPARHLSLDAGGRFLWTSLGTKAERIAVLDMTDTRRPRLRRVFAPPFLAHDVVVAPDGRHVWVTSGSRDALAIYRLGGGAPRLLAADAPPQHVCFTERHAHVASGADGIVRLHRLDGTRVRATRVPHGSYNVTYGSPDVPQGGPAAVTPSLDQGTLCVLSPLASVRFIRHVARSAHDACVAVAG
jgi:DNA-binding beta-propeller fold protein YncE